MKPFYKSRKLWVSVISVISVVVLQLSGKPTLSEAVVALGAVLVAALGLEDMGKAREYLSTGETLRPPPPAEVDVDLDAE